MSKKTITFDTVRRWPSRLFAVSAIPTIPVDQFGRSDINVGRTLCAEIDGCTHNSLNPKAIRPTPLIGPIRDRGTHLDNETSDPTVHRRLNHALAVWFVVQIVLPFTAPLQTCELADLLGTATHHGTSSTPESSATPPLDDADSFVSPLEGSELSASTAIVRAADVACRRFSSQWAAGRSLPPQVQQTVLRI